MSPDFPMTSSRPYLIRALNEWILENALTPYVMVSTEESDVQVPEQYVVNNKIILNISPQAVNSLYLGNDRLEFSARFGGQPMLVSVPVRAVMAIYAKENGRGMVFSQDDDLPPTDPGKDTADKKPKLKLVK